MTIMAAALQAAGLITETAAQEVSSQAGRRKMITTLCVKVQEALHQAQRSGRSGDMKKYMYLRQRLPRHFQSLY